MAENCQLTGVGAFFDSNISSSFSLDLTLVTLLDLAANSSSL